jgi:diadenosine tetraphosphate (Ap4A) HIT family hydrolase
MIIAQTKNFILESHSAPEVSRTDGGHLVINPKVTIEDRTLLPVDQVIELALFTNIAGQAMKLGLASRDIIIGRINYQDNGNWKPELHIHLYGRAINATYHIYGEPIKAARILEEKIVQTPLSNEDCAAIRTKLLEYSMLPGYESLGVEYRV